MDTARPPLRERKKRRTRDALIDAALDLFTRNGFAQTTLDELCEEVEVSKRTFFRNFTSKEDVAMAPLQDMWAAFLDELRDREPRGTVVETLRDALLAAVAAMPAEGWARRVVLSSGLTAATPSMNAHSLGFCDRTSLAAVEVLRDRLAIGDQDDVRPRLAVDLMVAVFHRALERWVSRPGPREPAGLAADIADVFALVPDILSLAAAPRG